MCAKKERFYETIFGIRRKTESDVQKSQFQKFFSGTVYTLIIFKQISDDAISKIWGAALGITPHLTMGLSRNASEFFPDTKLEKGRTILR